MPLRHPTKIPFVNTTKMRKNISAYVESVRKENSLLGLGRRNRIEVVLMKYPDTLNDALNDITNINAYSPSFDFLKDEPDLYTINDLKKHYA